MQSLTLTLPSSGISPVTILGGSANGITRTQIGTYQVVGRTAGNRPKLSQSNKAYEWAIDSAVTEQDWARLQDMIYAQSETRLGDILVDDRTRPIRPNLLNWGNRIAIDSPVSVSGLDRRYFRTYGIVILNDNDPEQLGLGSDGNQWTKLQCTILEVP